MERILASKNPTFAKAPAVVVANHAIKHDVNQLRAIAVASTVDTGTMYCITRDRPSLEALRARPYLPTQQIQWVKPHDRDSGDL